MIIRGIFWFRDVLGCLILWSPYVMSQWFVGGKDWGISFLTDDKTYLFLFLTLIWNRLVIISWDQTDQAEQYKTFLKADKALWGE